jgi:hypothetical protein
MKSFHRLMPLEIFPERRCGVGHIGEAEGFALGLPAIKRDFGAAQGTRPIKVNCRRLIRHCEEIRS